MTQSVTVSNLTNSSHLEIILPDGTSLADKLSQINSRLQSQYTKVQSALNPIESALDKVYDGLGASDYNAPAELEGSSLEDVNQMAATVTIFVVLCTVIGWLLDVGLFRVWARAEAEEKCREAELELALRAKRRKESSDSTRSGWFSSGETSGGENPTRATRSIRDQEINLDPEAFMQKGARPPAWSLLMLLSSYLLLVPAYSGMLFSFNIIVNIAGTRIEVQPDRDHKSCTESVAGLVNLLLMSGSPQGAFAVCLYAFIVPASKVILLSLGELFRFSESSTRVRLARRCVFWAQWLSKWACPDMFAYMMLIHLVRVLNTQPIILTSARLDTGFSCFSVFCLSTTLSSLGISLPELPKEDAFGVSLNHGQPEQRPLLVRLFGRRHLGTVAVLSCLVFLALMISGIQLPVMSLRIDDELLFQPVGSVPAAAKPIIDALGLRDMLASDVSFSSCMKRLMNELPTGETNSFIALMMLAVFVVSFTILDMLLLTCLAVHVSFIKPSSKVMTLQNGDQGIPEAKGSSLLPIVKVLQKIAMLDVAIMGVLVVGFCLCMYRKSGLVINMGDGLSLLAAAELLHLTAYHLITSAAEFISSNHDGYSAAGMDEADFEDPSIPANLRACCAAPRSSRLYLGGST